MTEDQAKIAALKFAIKMAQETRLATIEECAKTVESYNDLGEGTSWEKPLSVVLEEIANAIRSLSQPKPGKE